MKVTPPARCIGMANPIALLLLAANAEPEPKRGRILDRNGGVLAEMVDGKRHYPYLALAAHTLAYMRSTRRRDGDVESYLGLAGVEKSGQAQLEKPSPRKYSNASPRSPRARRSK